MPIRFSQSCPFLCAPSVFSGLSFLVCTTKDNQKKTYGHTKADNPEKTVGAQKKGQPRENRMGTHERITKPLFAPTVFSGLSALLCPYGFLWVVLSCVPLRFSLGCPFLCAPSVFSGLSFLVCPYGFLWVVLSCVPLRF
jgi:hypothetical protein